MRRIVLRLVGFGGVLTLVYFLGPKPTSFDSIPAIPAYVMSEVAKHANVESWIKELESHKGIRPGNESEFYWADSAGKPTEFVLLYLHGFSACPVEGHPVSTDFAKRYGMNLYAPLLSEHGLVGEEPMLNYTAESWILSAQKALAVAQTMGKKVIVMSTSTGCTSALYLASDSANKIHALINFSPNIRVFDNRAFLVSGPWGLQIARFIRGGKYNVWEAPKGAEQYWHTKYRLEAIVEMQKLLEATMVDSIFEQINVPTFVAYYYKNEEQQDDVVSAIATQEMFKKLGSPIKEIKQLEEVGAHAMASSLFSKDIDAVKEASFLFAETKLHLMPLTHSN
jgi:esterase/lipase|tara:strand:+ start:2879 stop:3892 length:1014 start_codon:yes stop_codon:yes gene_type:complete